MIDPPAEIQAGLATDRPQSELAGGAVALGQPIIGAEGIVLPDEAARRTPVAGGDGPAVAVEHIDRRRPGRRGQPLQLAIQRRAGRTGRDQCGRQVAIPCQRQRQQAEPGDLALEQCLAQPRIDHRLRLQHRERAPLGDRADDPCRNPRQ